MSDELALKQADRMFILKMIMAAEMSTSVYKYLVQNQNVFVQIEKGDINELPADYMNKYKDKDGAIVPPEKDKEILKKILQIIRMSPKVSDISIDLSKVFELVGFFEKEIEETTKFNLLAGEDAKKALNFLKTIEWDFDPRIRSLIAEISQEIGQITFDPANPADENQRSLITKFRNKAETALLVFKEYAPKEAFSGVIRKISPQFFEAFPPLGDRFSQSLNNLEIEFLNHALILSSEKFWQDFLAIQKFGDFSNFEQMIKNLDKQKLLESDVIEPILAKTLLFLDPNFEGVISLIGDKELLKIKNSNEFHKQLATFFMNQGDVNRRDALFDLFKKSTLTLESQLIILDDILAKTDYPKLNESLSNKNLIETLSSKRTKQLKSFLLRTADPNNQEFLNVFESIWKQENIARFSLLESSFFEGFTQRIGQIPNTDLKKQYVDLLVVSNLKNFILKSGAQTIYIDGLETIYKTIPRTTRQSPEAKLKTKISKFIAKLKGGGKRARRPARTTRKPRKRSK